MPIMGTQWECNPFSRKLSHWQWMRTGNRTLSLAHHGKMHSTVSKDMVVYVHCKLSVELYIFYFSNILMCCTFLPCFQQQVDEFLNVYCSVPDSIQKEGAWETQTYVHFCDGQGVALTLKPEHRVEDVLSLACKVCIFHVRLHLINNCGPQKDHNTSEDSLIVNE